MKFSPKDCYSRKIMKSHRIIGQIYRRYLSPFGITNSQMSILFMINQRNGLTQTDLANMLAMEKSTVSRNLRRLLDQKIITKKNNLIALTSKGNRLLEKIIPHWAKAMEEVRSIIGIEGESSLNLILKKLTQ